MRENASEPSEKASAKPFSSLPAYRPQKAENLSVLPPEVRSRLPPAFNDLPRILSQMWLDEHMKAWMISWIMEQIQSVLQAKLPDEAMQRLGEMIMSGIESIGGTSRADIINWWNSERLRSLWTLPDPTEATWCIYYQSQILKAFQSDIANACTNLKVAYGLQETVGKNKYNQANYTGYRDSIGKLDTKYGLSVWLWISEYTQKWVVSLDAKSLLGMVNFTMLRGDISRDNLSIVIASNAFDQIEWRLGNKLPFRLAMLQQVKAGTFTPHIYPAGSAEQKVANILQEYLYQFRSFQQAEQQVQTIRAVAEGQASSSDGALMTESMFTRKQENLAEQGFWELIKTLVGLGEWFWLIGNVISAQWNAVALRTGINTDGKITNRAIAGALLGADAFWIGFSWVNVVAKSTRSVQTLKKISEVLRYLPDAFERAIQLKTIRPETIEKVAQFIETIGTKMKELWMPMDTIMEKFRSIVSRSRWIEKKWIVSERPMGTATPTTIAEWRQRDKAWAEALNRSIQSDSERIDRIKTDFPELRNLTPEQYQELIAIHHINAWSETVWAYSVRSLGEKMKWLRAMNIEENTAKRLIQWGYLWRIMEAETSLPQVTTLGVFVEKLRKWEIDINRLVNQINSLTPEALKNHWRSIFDILSKLPPLYIGKILESTIHSQIKLELLALKRLSKEQFDKVWSDFISVRDLGNEVSLATRVMNWNTQEVIRFTDGSIINSLSWWIWKSYASVWKIIDWPDKWRYFGEAPKNSKGQVIRDIFNATGWDRIGQVVFSDWVWKARNI